MRYYRIHNGDGWRLVCYHAHEAYDLTAASDRLQTVSDLAAIARLVGTDLDGFATSLFDRADEMDPAPLDSPARPVVPDEVWAAGGTYRLGESADDPDRGLSPQYLDLYEREHAQLFFKATANHVVGPGEPIGIRGDSTASVPEPELGVVLYRGEPVGYTAGNDVSSRSMEMGNPLYLSMAKTYDRCCSIGPCVTTNVDPHDLSIRMVVERRGETVFEGETSTAELARTVEEIVSTYRRHNAVPEVAVVLTGTRSVAPGLDETPVVPPDDFTLLEGDVVRIEIEAIGTLENPVVTV